MCSLIFFRIMDTGFILLMAGYCILVHPECTYTLTDYYEAVVYQRCEKFRPARINHTNRKEDDIPFHMKWTAGWDPCEGRRKWYIT